MSWNAINTVAVASISAVNGVSIANVSHVNGVEKEAEGGSVWDVIASESAGSTNGNNVTTAAINTTGADLIVIGGSFIHASVTPSDSKSNTWSALTEVSQSTAGGTYTQRCRLWYCANPTTDGSHTFTLTQNGTFPCIFVVAVSGAHASPFDDESTNSHESAYTNTGAVVPSESDEFAVVVVGDNEATLPSINSGYSVIESTYPYVGYQHVSGALAYAVISASSNPTWSGTPARGSATAIACFKPA